MKAKTISLAIIAAIAATTLFTSCFTEKSTFEELQYTVAKNYFLKNGAKLPESFRITDQEIFDATFGMATVMGEDGKPTPIDFSKQFVIALEEGPVQKETELTPVSLAIKTTQHSEGGQTTEYKTLVFTYKISQGADISYTIRPVLAIIVDKAYENNDLQITRQLE